MANSAFTGLVPKIKFGGPPTRPLQPQRHLTFRVAPAYLEMQVPPMPFCTVLSVAISLRSVDGLQDFLQAGGTKCLRMVSGPEDLRWTRSTTNKGESVPVPVEDAWSAASCG